MSRTGHEVGLLFDTGHITFAGGDPMQVLQKHVQRICHVHCKDVRPEVVRRARNGQWSFLQSVLNGAFTVPGDGAVPFKPLLEALHQHGYRGWLVVEAEQDPAVAPSLDYARMGHDHLAAIVRELGGQPGRVA
jgi:inosose dehydratase